MRFRKLASKLLVAALALGLAAPAVKAQETEPADGDAAVEQCNDMVMHEVDVDYIKANHVEAQVDSANCGASSGQERNWSAYGSKTVYNSLSAGEKALVDELIKACDYAINTLDNYQIEDITGDGDYMCYLCKVPYTISDDDAKDIVVNFAYLCPQYYFVSNWYGAGDGYAYIFMYPEFANGADRANATSQFFGKMDSWKSTVMSSTSGRYNKEVFAHDLVCNSTVYDNDFSLGDWNQTAYSLVCGGETVCAGYAKTYATLMNSLGIDTICITGTDFIERSGHAWNRVNMYGDYYVVDLTWDDDPNGVGTVSYDFMNLPDKTDIEGYDDYDWWHYYCVDLFWYYYAPTCEKYLTGPSSGDTDPVAPDVSPVAPEIPEGEFAQYKGYRFVKDSYGDIRCYNIETGEMVINNFMCDGTYTYYFQADGTAMKDRLTYHPDGIHVIYFDQYGHEVFSDFANVKKSISGQAVDDMCFFNVYGYMYVDTLTYDKTGTKLYYVNPYGVLERTGWFAFSGNEFNAGLGFSGRSGGYGYANADCSLATNTYTYDWDGNYVYIQGDGHMFR